MADENMDSSELKGKEPESSTGEVSPTVGSWEDRTRQASGTDVAPRILFAPDPRESHRRQRSEDHTALTLTRTFSRQSRFSSYSTASDEEHARIRRVHSHKAEPHTRLPTSKLPEFRVCTESQSLPDFEYPCYRHCYARGRTN
jgi:hypothetical protein